MRRRVRGREGLQGEDIGRFTLCMHCPGQESTEDTLLLEQSSTGALSYFNTSCTACDLKYHEVEHPFIAVPLCVLLRSFKEIQLKNFGSY